ncbi:MAG TPA: hypothetical protein ENG92_02510 [Thiolapillus brandeum]|uniref:Uncharacterized protein n=1 Tax=Thiolapillus brandeum TaxID=1076588 RepID=A0A831KBN6_9GAMM|nr:hypothetical protein [Thiolapillus brandeum]
MNQHDFPVLNAYLADMGESVAPAWPDRIESSEDLLGFYDRLFSQLEEKLWKEGLDEPLLKQYQLLVEEMDQQLNRMGKADHRHHFIITIPVADRPQHLVACLKSLLQLNRCFPYGNGADGNIHKLSVLIADDSKVPENILENKRIAEDFGLRGLEVVYFGQQEQWEITQALGEEQKEQLQQILGSFKASSFYRKGASIMRNIAYLKLHEMGRRWKKTLYYFIDSDQEFQVKIGAGDDDRNIYALNYFYHLDRIFSRKDVVMLTGKVVGDPPVSPAVMASNFLDDVLTFLSQMANLDGKQDCRFHQGRTQGDDTAAYHDMADLFGFETSKSSFQYQCGVPVRHDHQACFQEFAGKLQQFFDGEHPTRKTYYDFSAVLENTVPARTVYTGNYVFKRAGLDYFIPFAPLRLRMAGPTMGRLISAELGNRFVSANLPMLHKRTITETGQSEFRPGIVREAQMVDLSGEFERQYFGDVMLFSMEKLTQEGYSQQMPDKQYVEQVLQQTESRLRKKYVVKHEQIRQKAKRLEQLLQEESCWWNSDSSLQSSVDEVRHFIANIKYNFGPDAKGIGYILSGLHQKQRLQQMLQAIMHYQEEQVVWQHLMKD